MDAAVASILTSNRQTKQGDKNETLSTSLREKTGSWRRAVTCHLRIARALRGGSFHDHRQRCGVVAGGQLSCFDERFLCGHGGPRRRARTHACEKSQLFRQYCCHL